MRGAFAVALAGLALGAVIGPATPVLAGPGQGRGRVGTSQCQSPARVSYHDAAVIVWTQDAPNAHVEFLACRRSTGRTVIALDFDDDCISPSGACEDVSPMIRRVVRAGPWLAMYVDDQVNAAIGLADLRSGTTPRVEGYVPRDVPHEMVLRRDGLLAWISDYLSTRFKRSRELRICDATCRRYGRRARRIARGRTLSRLRLHDGRVYWNNGKRTRSARAD
ncbi:MAG TPA: hypothetical protein VGJ32_14650 [Solirubrobacteraceae bacterium]|jgi:hypothetical protein